jgi:hypothetical protein
MGRKLSFISRRNMARPGIVNGLRRDGFAIPDPEPAQ